MNSLTARNAALLLVLYLLWFVFSGIYENHSQQPLAKEVEEFRQQEMARDKHARRSPNISASMSSAAHSDASEKSKNQRTLTADEMQQISITGRLPSWVKGSENKRLSIEELEEIMSSGKLPEL
jgi:hypothetical protein